MAKDKFKLTKYAPLFANHISITDEILQEYEFEKDKYAKQFGMQVTSDSVFIAHLLKNNNAEDISGVLAVARENELKARAKLRKNKKINKPNAEILRTEILIAICHFEDYAQKFDEYMKELEEIADDYGYEYEDEKLWRDRISKCTRLKIRECVYMKAEHHKVFNFFPNLLEIGSSNEMTFFKDFRNAIADLKNKYGLIDEDENGLFLTDEGEKKLRYLLYKMIQGAKKNNLYLLTYEGYMNKEYDLFIDTPTNEYFSRIVGDSFRGIYEKGITPEMEQYAKLEYKYRELSPEKRKIKISEELKSF